MGGEPILWQCFGFDMFQLKHRSKLDILSSKFDMLSFELVSATTKCLHSCCKMVWGLLFYFLHSCTVKARCLGSRLQGCLMSDLWRPFKGPKLALNYHLKNITRLHGHYSNKIVKTNFFLERLSEYHNRKFF